MTADHQQIPRQGPARAPTVAIVGESNVGKSSLFNRLLGRNRALVSKRWETTRDFLTGYSSENTGSWRFLDTPAGPVESVIQVVGGADLVLLVTDALRGCTPGDLDWARRLRRAGTPVLLVANKTESRPAIDSLPEFQRLALGDPVAVSAAHSAGIPGLREAIGRRLQEARKGELPGTSWLNIALVGRPNVGKSSLGNRLLGEHRSRVAEVPGTTRDRVEGWCSVSGRWFRILDTAGDARRTRDPLVYQAAGRTRTALEECDVAVLVLDVNEPVRGVERDLLGSIHGVGKPALIAGNKLDLLATGRREFLSSCREAFSFAGEPPVLLLSALTGQGCRRVLSTALRLARISDRRISTHKLHEFLRQLEGEFPKTRHRLRHAVQVGTRPPHFLVFHSSSRVPSNYKSFLKNRIRRHFHLEAVPVRVQIRRR